jgi:hypothetical protein
LEAVPGKVECLPQQIIKVAWGRDRIAWATALFKEVFPIDAWPHAYYRLWVDAIAVYFIGWIQIGTA